MRYLLLYTLLLTPALGFSQIYVLNDDNQILDKQTITSVAIFNNKIWLATHGGLIKLNKALTEHQIVDDTYILPGQQIFDLTIHSNKLWLVGNTGFANFDGTKWEKETPKEFTFLPRKMVFDSTGTLWIAGNRGFETTLLIAWQDQVLQQHDNKSGLFIDIVSGLTTDQTGNIWLSTYRGLNKYNGNQWHLYDKSTGLPSNHITGVVIGPKGMVWIGTKRNGISIFKNEEWHHRIGPNLPQILNFSKQGELIVARSKKEFSIFENGTWALYQPKLSKQQIITAITIDKTNFYIGTNKGLLVYPRE
ncbi:two-component regulator propeller domain-containing protein [Fodinibius halophilus]|uniref:Uncharacterized protein n=1 Tax=Fodinibius halophilus TaxID=1736908 RepID=A0A6M1SZA0_9BACT|nr:two-component regulator propeller domain-containing protein [Fodinibius halophilus]NGP89218.1 hypothetical protein [Fodinibius halophilus]